MPASLKTDLFRGEEFKVGFLEGLWWTVRGGADRLRAPKASWRWKLLLRVPTFVSARDLTAALTSLCAKRGTVEEVRLETISEGRVQRGLRYRGRHHEIYLSDPRRVAPSRIRTILRHAVG